MPSAPFSKIAVIGPGLMGGSILLACKARNVAREVAVWGAKPEELEEVRRAGIDCRLSSSIQETVSQAELVILCVPIGVMDSVLAPALTSLAPEAVVTDVGSVKGVVVELLEPLVSPYAHWIGGHPMAGRERTGFAAAQANLFQGATTILAVTPQTSVAARERVTTFWTALGSKVIEMSPETHDTLVAEISHLPHLVAAALTQSVSSDSLPLIGSGFRDTTRVASGPAEMWQEILVSNRTAVNSALDKLILVLEETRRALKDNDPEQIKKLLSSANQLRQLIVKH